jgi:hypothetical protein
MNDHRIVIRPEGNAFAVEVHPPHEDHPARLFGDARSARGCASGIKITTGWTKVDQIGEISNG